MKRHLHFGTFLTFLVLIIAAPVLVTRSTVDTSRDVEQIRAYSRTQEFDYVKWEMDAIWQKLLFTALGIPKRVSVAEGRDVIDQTMGLHYQIRLLEWQIDQVYSNPDIPNPDQESFGLKQELAAAQESYHFFAGTTEALIESQINHGLSQEGISVLGQAFPPVLYRFSPLPKALIVSPRDQIRQDANISLNPEISFDDILGLENNVADTLDVSTLVTDIGGVGTYPSMVFQSSNLDWLLSTISHEWTHNYLTLRPLGMNYGTSGETRTMNETTADIVGEMIKWNVAELYFPELIPEEVPETSADEEVNPEPNAEEPVFDFAFEMYVTRRETDKLLAEGKIEEAEAYMESRREFFWENGYQIRKLNQAYFAFHAAYVNAPSTGEEGQTGAAGKDPVGPAVWQLYESSENLATFLRKIAWITSFADLQEALVHQ